MQGLILVVVYASPGHLSVRRLGGPFAKIEPRGVQLAGEHLRAGLSGSGPNTPETLQACREGAFGHRVWIRGTGLFTNMRRRNKFGKSHWQLRRALTAFAYGRFRWCIEVVLSQGADLFKQQEPCPLPKMHWSQGCCAAHQRDHHHHYFSCWHNSR